MTKLFTLAVRRPLVESSCIAPINVNVNHGLGYRKGWIEVHFGCLETMGFQWGFL